MRSLAHALGRAVSSLAALAFTACLIPGSAKLEVSPTARLSGPKVIAVMGTRNDVVASLEEALSAYGFTFTRYQNRDRVTSPAGQVRMGENLEDDTKYALEIVPDIFERCLGGGFNLTSLRVAVVDRATNELMLRMSAKGRTEKCAPASGAIFHNIAKAIDDAWQR